MSPYAIDRPMTIIARAGGRAHTPQGFCGGGQLEGVHRRDEPARAHLGRRGDAPRGVGPLQGGDLRDLVALGGLLPYRHPARDLGR